MIKKIMLALAMFLILSQVSRLLASFEKKKAHEIKKAFLFGQQIQALRCLAPYQDVQAQLDSLYHNEFILEHKLLE